MHTLPSGAGELQAVTRLHAKIVRYLTLLSRSLSRCPLNELARRRSSISADGSAEIALQRASNFRLPPDNIKSVTPSAYPVKDRRQCIHACGQTRGPD